MWHNEYGDGGTWLHGTWALELLGYLVTRLQWEHARRTRGKYGPAAGSVIPRKRRVCICRPIQPGGVGSGARGDTTDGTGSK